jgi:hypothetical protein
MNLINWLQTNAPAISLLFTVLLVIITGVYVYLTKKIVDTTVRQVNIIHNPVIGIRLGAMWISKTNDLSRRNLSVSLNLTNIGNAPAIKILVDGEIIFKYIKVDGINEMPARFEPRFISYMRPGEELSAGQSYSLSFGNDGIRNLLDDLRENRRLNMERIETTPSRQPYPPPRLIIYVYYQNNLGQYFQSIYKGNLNVNEIPKDDESVEVKEKFLPSPEFISSTISLKEIEKNISFRNSRRILCGW